MPTCTVCGHWWAPRQAASGRCPDCGGEIYGAPGTDPGRSPPKEKLPWHLKLLAASFVLYMGWRLVQGIQWLAQRF